MHPDRAADKIKRSIITISFFTLTVMSKKFLTISYYSVKPGFHIPMWYSFGMNISATSPPALHKFSLALHMQSVKSHCNSTGIVHGLTIAPPEVYIPAL